MITNVAQMFTLGDLARDERFREYSRRQIEYAIQEHRIEPAGRVGIIRVWSEDTIPRIKSALVRIAQNRGGRW